MLHQFSSVQYVTSICEHKAPLMILVLVTVAGGYE